ncbi:MULTISPECIES: MFS transporter [unclassified Streptomyces]|uniref:MFS transporter n=1 Tax=unclassified Streptomyces TaxID=2593676 RepID=UPI0033A67CA0
MRLPTGQRLPRTVWLLIAARAINRLGAFSLSFLTVLITTRFGASVATAGLISAAFGLATIPSRLAGGRLSDRIGRRRTIVFGLVGCAVAQVGIAAADSLAVAAGFAVLLGLVFELYEPPSQAMIADAVGTTDRVRAYSLMNAALAAAGMGAGLLAASLGRWDLRWLFVADATTCLICALAVRVALPADLPAAHRLSEETAEVAPWRDRALMVMLASGTLFALIYLQIMIMLPLSLGQRGLQPADAGLLLTASALTIVAGQPLLRWKLVSALPTAAGFTSGYALLTLGLAGYAVAHTLGFFLAATVVWSLGDLLLMGRAYALVAALAPPAGTGRYMAAYGTSWGIAGIAAPLAGTQLLQHAGVTTLWITMATACLALSAIQPAIGRIVSARTSQPASTEYGAAPVSA